MARRKSGKGQADQLSSGGGVQLETKDLVTPTRGQEKQQPSSLATQTRAQPQPRDIVEPRYEEKLATQRGAKLQAQPEVKCILEHKPAESEQSSAAEGGVRLKPLVRAGDEVPAQILPECQSGAQPGAQPKAKAKKKKSKAKKAKAKAKAKEAQAEDVANDGSGKKEGNGDEVTQSHGVIVNQQIPETGLSPNPHSHHNPNPLPQPKRKKKAKSKAAKGPESVPSPAATATATATQQQQPLPPSVLALAPFLEPLLVSAAAPRKWDEYEGDGSLDDWNLFMRDLGFEQYFSSKNQCKKALDKTFINITDLVDAIRSNGATPLSSVRRFESPAALASYTRKSRRNYQRQGVASANPLSGLLQDVLEGRRQPRRRKPRKTTPVVPTGAETTNYNRNYNYTSNYDYNYNRYDNSNSNKMT
ncbi:hypothetical protein F5Y17DRAFT_458332 [Xylariaceae sp. FL0594]|nr:hypothetical protein F5Y17DRAFT_458332 [Xylariaceae sp. FL0594]